MADLGSYLFGNSGTSAANTLQPAINQASQYTNQFGGAANGANDQMATGSTTGSQYATNQVANNPILGGLFGKNGTLNQAEGLNRDLNANGYQLNSMDQDAMGQASNNIARSSGHQQQGLANSLASRGFGGAASGAAGAAFSGAAGNAQEQLAQAQTQIAQQRVQNTQNRINANNQLMTSLGQQAGNDINQQYGRQMSGAQFGAGQNQQGVENAAAGQNETNEQFGQQQNTKGNGLLGTALNGMVSGMSGGFAGAGAQKMLGTGGGGGGGGESGGGSLSGGFGGSSYGASGMSGQSGLGFSLFG